MRGTTGTIPLGAGSLATSSPRMGTIAMGTTTREMERTILTSTMGSTLESSPGSRPSSGPAMVTLTRTGGLCQTTSTPPCRGTTTLTSQN